MNFGKWIVVAFVFFAIFIGTLVTICVRQDVTLVTKEYYKEELVYEDQIQRIRNTNSLAVKPQISVKENTLKISYNRFPEITKGKVVLFRPSDSKFDHSYTLKPTSEESQQFELTTTPSGLYKARLSWEQQGKEYFFEQIVVL